jgi:hypothetical protein
MHSIERGQQDTGILQVQSLVHACISATRRLSRIALLVSVGVAECTCREVANFGPSSETLLQTGPPDRPGKAPPLRPALGYEGPLDDACQLECPIGVSLKASLGLSSVSDRNCGSLRR